MFKNGFVFAALLSVLVLSGAGNLAEARLPMPGPIKLSVDGLRAEYLFEILNGLESVPGLEGTVDCAMGTCQAQIKRVTCAKTLTEGSESLACTFRSTAAGGAEVRVTSRDVPAVSALRRALVEIAGREVTRGSVKTVTAISVQCEGKRLSRELDELNVETTFTCVVTR